MSLKASFRRALVNHPAKTKIGGPLVFGGGTTLASALMIAPLDGGISAVALGFSTFAVSFFNILDLGISPSHSDLVELEHDGDVYVVSKPQQQKYSALEHKIKIVQDSYKLAKTDSERSRLRRRGEKLFAHQEDILASKNVNRKADFESNPPLILSRKSGLGN